jgi:hypothetical protein
MNIKRLDDPSIPVASTLVGLILYGMQGGQTVKVIPTLLEGLDGVDGVDGASAYEEWVANGGVGTFQDFLDEIVETVNLLVPQTFTEGQKAQARANIDALTSSAVADVTEYNEITI